MPSAKLLTSMPLMLHVPSARDGGLLGGGLIGSVAGNQRDARVPLTPVPLAVVLVLLAMLIGWSPT